MNKKFVSLFGEFQRIPKGVLIDRPGELITTEFSVNTSLLRILGVDNAKVYFTRRTLKHLSEKGSDGASLFLRIPIVLKRPDAIYGSNSTRILVIRSTDLEKEGEFYAVVLESANLQEIIIVTSFVAKQKYLKNFEILWRTAASS